MGVHWDHETARFAVLNFLIDCMKQTLVSMIQEAEDKNIRDRLRALLSLIDGGKQEYLARRKLGDRSNATNKAMQ